MHEEDPTWEVEQSKELKQTILSGQGEFHLRTLKWRVENNDKLPIVFEEPKIPYRETITKLPVPITVTRNRVAVPDSSVRCIL